MSTENTTLDPFAIFNTSLEDVKSFDEGNGRLDFSEIFYEPDPQKDKPYACAVKFLTNIYSPNDPLVKKFLYKLVHPTTGKPLYWDSPSTVNQECFVLNEWSRLKNSEDTRDQKKAGLYRRTRQRCVVVQIVRDLQKPELEGEIRLMRLQYDGDIEKMINAKMFPDAADLKMDPTLKAYDVFSIFGSPTLVIKAEVTTIKDPQGKEKDIRSFAGSKWNDNITGMLIEKGETPEQNVYITEADKPSKDDDAATLAAKTAKLNKAKELLEQEHVNMKEHFMYKPASEDKIKLVQQAIAKMSNAPVTADVAGNASAAPAQNAEVSEPTPTEAAPAVQSAGSVDAALAELGL